MQSIQQENPHLSYSGDGAQVPSYLKESCWRCGDLTSKAGCTALIHNEWFRFEETQQMWGLFTLAHSDLMTHTQKTPMWAISKKIHDMNFLYLFTLLNLHFLGISDEGKFASRIQLA